MSLKLVKTKIRLCFFININIDDNEIRASVITYE